MTITTLLIDHETRSRNALGVLLEQSFPSINIVAEAFDILSGINAIKEFQPDLVFLAIELPNYSGFQLIEHFEELNFLLVLITAKQQYVFKAFDTPALGYLLKPIKEDALHKIMKQVIKIISNKQIDYDQKDQLPKTIKLKWPALNGWIYTSSEEVVYLASEGRYTHLQLNDGTKVISTLSLKDCQLMLANSTFLRVHRSYIINLIHLRKYSKGRDSYVLMDNDIRIDVGKNYKTLLSELVSNFIK